jgi:DoxX
MSETISGEIDWHATLFGTRAPGWSILVRFLVGLVVFLPEGIQKLAFPDILGAGRFANIGIPYPELMGPFVGIVEIICGTLIILGLLTRLASGVPLRSWRGATSWACAEPVALLPHAPAATKRTSPRQRCWTRDFVKTSTNLARHIKRRWCEAGATRLRAGQRGSWRPVG